MQVFYSHGSFGKAAPSMLPNYGAHDSAMPRSSTADGAETVCKMLAEIKYKVFTEVIINEKQPFDFFNL